MALARRLTATEIEAYDVLSFDDARRVRIVTTPSLWGPFHGLALGRFVFVARPVPDDGSSTLLAHELVHVRQWSELGVAGFLSRYIPDFTTGLIQQRSWMAAYRQLGVEAEARADTRRWRRRSNASHRSEGQKK